jgi:hypothetical protein
MHLGKALKYLIYDIFDLDWIHSESLDRMHVYVSLERYVIVHYMFLHYLHSFIVSIDRDQSLMIFGFEHGCDNSYNADFILYVLIGLRLGIPKICINSFN